MTHPFAVAALLLRAGCPDELVVGCTEPNRGAPWEERKRHTMLYLRDQAPPSVKLVACADKLDNLRSMAADYVQQGDRLWLRFNRGRDARAWYGHGLARALAPEVAAGACPLLCDAFQAEVARLFGPDPGDGPGR